jgi:hypothetical protein
MEVVVQSYSEREKKNETHGHYHPGHILIEEAK